MSLRRKEVEERRFRPKRIMAFMPEEEPVRVVTDDNKYTAKLVNISPSGALLSMNEATSTGVGTSCRLVFQSGEGEFGIQGKCLRSAGRYAAFKFVEPDATTSGEISRKIDRMEKLTALHCPKFVN
jgi:hypothetical protein